MRKQHQSELLQCLLHSFEMRIFTVAQNDASFCSALARRLGGRRSPYFKQQLTLRALGLVQTKG